MDTANEHTKNKGEEHTHTRKHKCRHRYVTCHATETATIKAPKWVKRQAQVCYLATVPSCRLKGHTPPSSSRLTGPNRRQRGGPEPAPRKQASKKTETHTRVEAGKKCMPGRRASQRRVEERVRSDEATEETGGSQQHSKGRAQVRGHSKHTNSTTPQRSIREGGTRGTGERQHHAPRHAQHRHHTHRTHAHPRPQHVASRPRQSSQREGSRGRGGA